MITEPLDIGIIGSGGAGMCAAWLLDKGHHITLLEKKDYLGGNTHTVDVEMNGRIHHVDDGANWFSPSIYPHFNRLLSLMDIPIDKVPLSLTYHNRITGRSNCMPPVTFRRIVQMFTRQNVLPELLQLNKVVSSAESIVHDRQTDITLGQFMGRLKLTETFRQDFLKPMLSGVWGSPFSETENFSVYPLMKYIVHHKPSGLKYFKWNVIRGGTKNYIRIMADSLKNTVIFKNDAVVSIRTLAAEGKIHVRTKSGRTFEFDRLIITAGARDAAIMLKDTLKMPEVQKALNRFHYYKATVCTHSDPGLMPPDRKDWSVVNVLHKGQHADATIWDGRDTDDDLFDSYISEGDEPKNVHFVSEWWLPSETPEFYRAQKDLEKVQGTANIYFGGDYTRDIGSHEDAIDSAMAAAQRIWPQSGRLQKLQGGPSLPK